jgi:acyl-CoA reductase-like NAD-dependent aldehyde dehydrogenase
MNTALASAESLAEIAQRCRQAQAAWARLPIQQRLQPVRTARGLLVQECDRLCAAVARDLGKPADEIVGGELLPLAEACRFLQRQAGRLLRSKRISLGQRPLWLWGQTDRVERRPRGLVGIIGTWNFPLLLNGVQILQALTAGNGVLWKPSEVAPASAEALFGLLARAGFPTGLLKVLPATREAGQELVDAAVDHVIFTGSSATGRRVAEHLGRRLVSSTLELSGCDALFVLEDADIDLAARAAWFAFSVNRGQTCIAARRALVQRRLYPAFVEALKPFVTAAPPLGLALAAQARQAERLIHDAVNEGAHVLKAQPGTANDGDAGLCRPAVVVDARPEMAICREASFAPLLAVLPFDTVEEALHMDAQCPYGLAASIFTSNPQRGTQLARQLRVGMVTINDVVVPTAHPATPFGGCGESGWGVTQGAEGLLEMTVPQTISVRRGTFRPHYPTVEGKTVLTPEAVRGLLEWGHGATLRQRLAGLWRVVRGR